MMSQYCLGTFVYQRSHMLLTHQQLKLFTVQHSTSPFLGGNKLLNSPPCNVHIGLLYRSWSRHLPHHLFPHWLLMGVRYEKELDNDIWVGKNPDVILQLLCCSEATIFNRGYLALCHSIFFHSVPSGPTAVNPSYSEYDVLIVLAEIMDYDIWQNPRLGCGMRIIKPINLKTQGP